MAEANPVDIGTSRVRRQVSFMVVGTPRSGTTLVQRIACELPGVGMPPETHFFGFFASGLIRRRRFPLAGKELQEELEAFASLDKSKELGINVRGLFDDLGGRCRSPIDMFDAIVRQLAGAALVYGEKSPEHLLWWRPLTAARPSLRFVFVVRDPRATVASAIAAWGGRTRMGELPHVQRAERWALDQRQVTAAESALGPQRGLVLRYEDVVRSPVDAREQLARFLRVGMPSALAAAHQHEWSTRIVLPREWWKSRALDPITEARVDAWRAQLTDKEGRDVALICRSAMKRFGYATDGASVPKAAVRMLTLDPRAQWWRLRLRAGQYRQQIRIDRFAEALVDSDQRR